MATFGDWQAYSQEDSAGLNYGLAGQIVGDNAYVMMVKADKPGVAVENAAVLRALTSIKIAGKDEIAIKSYADLEATGAETGGQPGRQRLGGGGAPG